MRAERVVVRWSIWLITIGLMVGFSFRPLPVLATRSASGITSSQLSQSSIQPDQRFRWFVLT